MKKIIFLAALTIFIFSGCKKSDAISCPYTTPTTVATSAEISYLQNYLSVNTIAAVQHESGVFYKINNPGTGISPGVCSNINVKYTGRVLGGNVFDANSTGATFILGDLIIGWQRVLPILKEGGSITLYIPPSLGYGSGTIRDNMGNVLIPANSYLHFDIELVDVL